MASTKELLKDAKSALDAGEIDAALAACREVLKKDKNNYMAYVIAGVAAKRKNEPERAVQAYEKAIKINEKLPAAWKGLYEALSDIKEPSEAHLDRLIQASNILLGGKAENPSAILLKKAEAFSRLSALDDNNLPEAVDEWLALAQKTEDFELETKAWKEVFKLYRVLEEGSPGSLGWDHYQATLSALYEQKNKVDLETAEFISRQVVKFVRRSLTNAESAVRSLQQLHERAPGCVRCMENLLILTEEDDADVLSYGDYQKLSMKLLHINPLSEGVELPIYMFQVRKRTGKNPFDVAPKGQRSGKSQIEMISSGASENPFRSVTEALFVSNTHLQADEPKLAEKAASLGLSLCDTEEKLGRRLKRNRDALQLTRGYANFQMGKPKTAKKLLAELVQSGTASDKFRKLATRGVVRIEAEDDAHSTTSIDEVLGFDPEDPESQMIRSWHSVVSGEQQVASQNFEAFAEEALRRDRAQDSMQPRELHFLSTVIGSDMTTVQATCLRYAAQMKMSRGHAGAKELLVKSASLAPKIACTFALLGAYFEKQASGNSSLLERARRCYEKAIGMDPAEELAGQRLVRHYLQRGDRDSALNIAREASESDSRAFWAFFAAGKISVEQESFFEATELLQRALRFSESSTLLSVKKALYFGAEDFLPSAQEVSRLMHLARLLLARAYHKFGKLSAAATSLRAALTDPSLDISLRVLANVQLGDVLTQLGEYRKAREAYAIASATAEDGGIAPPLMNSAESLYLWAEEEWVESRWKSAISLWSEAEEEFVKAAGRTSEAIFWKRAGDSSVMVARASLSLDAGADISDGKMVSHYSRAAKLQPWNEENLRDLSLALALKGFQNCSARLSMSILQHTPQKSDSWINHALVSALSGPSSVDEALHCMATASDMGAGEDVIYLVGVVLRQQPGKFAEALICAGEALRYDPESSDGWLLLGLFREQESGDDPEKLRSAISAFERADLLGGGPEAVQGLHRVLVKLHSLQKGTTFEAYFAHAAGGRLGLQEDPPTVSKAIMGAIAERKEKASLITGDRFTHMFPDLAFAC